MPKSENQKRKLLYLLRILSEETDEEHSLTMPEILEKLGAYDIAADRKTIYADLQELENAGYDILGEREGNSYQYSLASRDFELPELKLLVDSVQASRFITEKKSRELIKKLGTLTSRHNAGKLKRELMYSGRVKTMNESIYYTVDKLHAAMNEGSMVRFQYYNWNVKKEQELRHDGAYYEVSPWALLWDDENYYLVAYDAKDQKLKHFRVDKMLRLLVTDKKREGEKAFKEAGVESYSTRMFGMFSGKDERVTLEAENRFAGILIDRFGKDIMMIPIDADHFRATVSVSLSEQFLSWVFSLGEGIKITGPESAVKAAREMLARLNKMYTK